MGDLIARAVESVLAELIDDFRVTVLQGPRQAGKSTLMNSLQARRGGRLVSLDDQATREAAEHDPEGLIAALGSPAWIDEVQRGGDPLVLAIKAAVDRDPSRRFVLTGSADFLTVPRLSESLAGRAVFCPVWPLAEGEIAGRADTFLDQSFERLHWVDLPDDTTGGDVWRAVVRGGFPEVLALSSQRSRSTWFDGYVQTTTRRDVTELSAARQLDDLPRLLRLLAARTSQVLVKSRLSPEVEIERHRLASYLGLLSMVFLVRELPVWSRNLGARVTKHPKIHLTDSGLAASLLGVSAEALADPLNPLRGPLFETFVFTQLLRQTAWSDRRVSLHHYRDGRTAEVDVVLEADNGDLVGIECKAVSSVRGADFNGLRKLADVAGSSFRHGFVVHTGSAAGSFGPGMTALPVRALWKA